MQLELILDGIIVLVKMETFAVFFSARIIPHFKKFKFVIIKITNI